VQLVGNAGLELVKLLHSIAVNMRKDCWLTNALICRPTQLHGGRLENRTPTKQEIDYCRPHLQKTLEDLKPDVVIPLGKPAVQSIMALAWKDGEVDDIGRWAGWQIPSVKLNCWICPTYHPSFLLHEKSNAAELHVRRHLAAAFRLKGKPWPGPPDWQQRIKVEMDPGKAAQQVRALVAKGKPLAFDYETTTLKPDGPHAQILCCAVSDGLGAVAYPWAAEAIEATREMVTSGVPMIAANIPFEERWTRVFLKVPVKNWYWDTVLGAHWLDCRHGICSVKFQSFVRFGAPDYDGHIEPFRSSPNRDSNEPNRLREVEPRLLLEYCGYDALFESWIAQEQMKGLEPQSL
jgi:uracil-DNA glycosylase family 4